VSFGILIREISQKIGHWCLNKDVGEKAKAETECKICAEEKVSLKDLRPLSILKIENAILHKNSMA